ncbi:hypothetical protein C4D60_Mb08t08560 [Musa balbisiana]|uniref:Uncharacterized protein n=1 Tax=Musa balbisiana TaxID=52838 RepID=A0A4S8K2A7_MUSBA|nr:hypothetical protein C4D60_Mb08t08560 [Musa balbisiana]
MCQYKPGLFPYVELLMYHLLQSSLEKTVDRSQKFMKAEKYFDKHNEKEQKVQERFGYTRFLETDFATLNIDGLEQLENDLNDAIKWTISRKTPRRAASRVCER